jgi:hypothetical protein
MLSCQKLGFDSFQIGSFDMDGNISTLDYDHKEIQVTLQAGLHITDPGCIIEIPESVFRSDTTGIANIDSLQITRAELPDGVEECACVLQLFVIEPDVFKQLPICSFPFTFYKNSDWAAVLSSIDSNIKKSRAKSQRLEDELSANKKRLDAISKKIKEAEDRIVGNNEVTAAERLSSVQSELDSLDNKIKKYEDGHHAAALDPVLTGSRPAAGARIGLLGVPADFARIDANIKVACCLRIALSSYLGPRMGAIFFASDQDLINFQAIKSTNPQERRRRLGYSIERAWNASASKVPHKTAGYLGPACSFLGYNAHCVEGAKKLIEAFLGDLAVFDTYSSAQAYGQGLWRQSKRAPSMVGLDRPKKIIRSDGGEYRAFPCSPCAAALLLDTVQSTLTRQSPCTQSIRNPRTTFASMGPLGSFRFGNPASSTRWRRRNRLC